MSVLPTGNNHSRIIVLKDFIKELDLTEEEREAFRKARSQVQTHCAFFIFYIYLF